MKICVGIKNGKDIVQSINIASKSGSIDETREELYMMKPLIYDITHKLNRNAGEMTPSISFDEAVTAVKKIRISDGIKFTEHTMLGKSLHDEDYTRTAKRGRIVELKLRTMCRICHESEHWWSGKTTCARAMEKRHSKEGRGART